MRRRFCWSSVSYSAARCDRIVGSEESSVCEEYLSSHTGIVATGKEPFLYSLSARSNSARFRSWCARAIARILSTSRSCAYLSVSLLLRREVTSSGYNKPTKIISLEPFSKWRRREKGVLLTRFSIILHSSMYLSAPRALPSWSSPCVERFSKASKKYEYPVV